MNLPADLLHGTSSVGERETSTSLSRIWEESYGKFERRSLLSTEIRRK